MSSSDKVTKVCVKNGEESENVVTKNSANNNTMKNDTCNNKNRKSKLKDKVFVERKSLIHEMYDVQHIRNIHYIFMVLLLTLTVNHIVHGIIHEGRLSLHITPIIQNFSDGHLALVGWLIIFGLTLLVYPVFHLWASTYSQITTTILKESWNGLWIAIVLGYYYEVFEWAGTYVTENDLTFTSSFALTVEATRLLMKTHAFIRTNVTKLHNEKENFKLAPFRHYLEFLFMPTLVFRDSYPRTKAINWTSVFVYFFEFCGCVFFICYLYNMYFAPDCNHFKVSSSFQLKDFAWLIFRNTVPSLGIMIIMFYLILHLIQNLFGELTRFADRQFYQDWWNSTSYDEYYRKWNVVVHDWLYNYVYKDVFEAFNLKSPLIPKLLVFLISAIVHEYILYYTMRMFYPVLGTIFFTFGMIFTSFRSPQYWLISVLFLYSYGLGFSITITSYVIEFCVRQNPCAANSTMIPFDWLYSKTLFNDCVN